MIAGPKWLDNACLVNTCRDDAAVLDHQHARREGLLQLCVAPTLLMTMSTTARLAIPLHGGCGADTLCPCEGSSISSRFHPQFCEQIVIFGEVPPARKYDFLIFRENNRRFWRALP